MNTTESDLSCLRKTDFLSDLSKRESKDIHRSLVSKILAIKKKCDPSSITFSDDHSREIDDILSLKIGVKTGVGRFEYKTDYKSKKSGNIVLEIITQVNEKSFIDLGYCNFAPNDPRRKDIIDFVEDAKNGKIVGAKMSRHFLNNEKPYYLSYIMSNSQDIKSESDVFKHLIFDGSKISDFVVKNYRNNNIIVTKSENKNTGGIWFTVSSLFKIELIEKLSVI